jgi:hypothetical protein
MAWVGFMGCKVTHETEIEIITYSAMEAETEYILYSY